MCGSDYHTGRCTPVGNHAAFAVLPRTKNSPEGSLRSPGGWDPCRIRPLPVGSAGTVSQDTRVLRCRGSFHRIVVCGLTRCFPLSDGTIRNAHLPKDSKGSAPRLVTISRRTPLGTTGRTSSPLLWLRNRGDQFGAPPRIDDSIRRLAVLVEFPMPAGVGIWRVENRPLEKAVHVLPCPTERWPAAG
jgi:hypothetical protein